MSNIHYYQIKKGGIKSRHPSSLDQVRHDKDTFDAASFYKAYKANSFNIPSVAPALPFTNWPALSPAAFKTSA